MSSRHQKGSGQIARFPLYSGFAETFFAAGVPSLFRVRRNSLRFLLFQRAFLMIPDGKDQRDQGEGHHAPTRKMLLLGTYSVFPLVWFTKVSPLVLTTASPISAPAIIGIST